MMHEREFKESRTFGLRIPTYALTLNRDEVLRAEKPEEIVAAVFDDAVKRSARRYGYTQEDKVF